MANRITRVQLFLTFILRLCVCVYIVYCVYHLADLQTVFIPVSSIYEQEFYNFLNFLDFSLYLLAGFIDI